MTEALNEDLNEARNALGRAQRELTEMLCWLDKAQFNPRLEVSGPAVDRPLVLELTCGEARCVKNGLYVWAKECQRIASSQLAQDNPNGAAIQLGCQQEAHKLYARVEKLIAADAADFEKKGTADVQPEQE